MLHIYDTQQKSVRHLKVHDGRVTALAIHPSGKYFATGSAREDVRIWDLDGKLLGESRFVEKATRPVSAAYALAFSPDGDTFVAATTNPEKSLQIFDLKAHPLDTIKVSNHYQGGAIAFSKSGRWLAATANNTVVVWDWPARKLVHVLKGHSDFIEGLSFTPDEEHLVTAGEDGTTRVWRLDNGYSMALLAHGGDWIAYTPDGYFDSSHYGGDLVSMTRGLDTYGIDQFALQLNRPDLILSRLGIGSPELIEHLRWMHQRRLERGGFHPSAPGLSLEVPHVQLIVAKQDGKFAQIEATINDQHDPLQSYQIYVNNVPIFRGQARYMETVASFAVGLHEGPLFRQLGENRKTKSLHRAIHLDATDRVLHKHAIHLASTAPIRRIRCAPPLLRPRFRTAWRTCNTPQASTTKVYERRGYNPEKSASFFATY